MLKICYLNLLWTNSPGIYRKIIQQANALRQVVSKEKIADTICIVTRENYGFLAKKTEIKTITASLFGISFIDHYLLPFTIWKQLQSELSLYDVIVMRWTVPTNQLVRISKKHKLITEHHTKELPELALKRNFSGYAQSVLENAYGPEILKNTVGIVRVTGEIGNYELNRAQVAKPLLTLANGVSVDQIPFTAFTRYKKGEPLRIIFVSSHFASWHGLDRMINGVRKWNGKMPKVELFLAGTLSNKLKKIIEHDQNIHELGMLTGDNLGEVIAFCHLAVGSLAEHRTGLSEACPLKTREYIARGIPFVYAYNDPDISDEVPWALKIQSDEQPVDIEMLFKFAEEVSFLDRVSNSMRSFAVSRLDWKIKMGKLVDFVEKCV